MGLLQLSCRVVGNGTSMQMTVCQHILSAACMPRAGLLLGTLGCVDV